MYPCVIVAVSFGHSTACYFLWRDAENCLQIVLFLSESSKFVCNHCNIFTKLNLKKYFESEKIIEVHMLSHENHANNEIRLFSGNFNFGHFSAPKLENTRKSCSHSPYNEKSKCHTLISMYSCHTEENFDTFILVLFRMKVSKFSFLWV
jgi:hypothetical protein